MISVSNNTLMLHMLIVICVFQRGILPLGQNRVSSSVSGTLTVVVTLLALDTRRPRHWEDVNVHEAQLSHTVDKSY